MPKVKTIMMAIWLIVSSLFNVLDLVSSIYENVNKVDFQQMEVELPDMPKFTFRRRRMSQALETVVSNEVCIVSPEDCLSEEYGIALPLPAQLAGNTTPQKDI